MRFTKSVTVLDLIRVEYDKRERPFRGVAHFGLTETIDSEELNESRAFPSGRPTLNLDFQEWRDFGSPEQLTVTIQPGDELNQ